MKTFKDWVRETKGIDIDEACSDTGDIAGYARRLDSGGMIKRMDQKPIAVGNDLKPKGSKKKKSKVKDMAKDFDDL